MAVVGVAVEDTAVMEFDTDFVPVVVAEADIEVGFGVLAAGYKNRSTY